MSTIWPIIAFIVSVYLVGVNLFMTCHLMYRPDVHKLWTVLFFSFTGISTFLCVCFAKYIGWI